MYVIGAVVYDEGLVFDEDNIATEDYSYHGNRGHERREVSISANGCGCPISNAYVCRLVSMSLVLMMSSKRMRTTGRMPVWLPRW